MSQRQPTRAELLASTHKSVPDVIARGLKVLFCGINPGLYSAWSGHHFARPGNRFWPTLHAGGFTERQLHPSEERELLEAGYGITNVVERASAAADELSTEEFVAGGRRLRARVKRYRPRYLAVLGVGAYRIAFDQPRAVLGLQAETVGETKVWVLPNPSGLNAHYRARDLAQLFGKLLAAVDGA
ncbi:MAG TPA: G/U mismatch-specific DNA glycosylase [Gemmataceae bacterium]|nr:G/U mismatch-specific DNA glycosylase [Gemmataceae bacterium]